ncbi:MAG: Uma2 family endonuclease [Thermoflexibacteraceae bacterium]|jgi:Uma2 family endonuclease
MSPSRNHSYFQLNTGYSLKNQKKFSVFSELSLLIDGKEYVPDIAVYPPMKINRSKDILKMTEMPLLAIEILSPTQGTQELLDKFEIYFAAGIKSCWLIEPAIGSVTVYENLDTFKTFVEGIIVDRIMDIQLPFIEIFD